MKPGIHAIDADAYQNDNIGHDTPSLSASIAKILINQSPLHAWHAHPRLNPNVVREEKEMFDLGTVAHALLLQGMNVAHIIQAKTKEGETVSDWRTKAAQDERDKARAAGKIPILLKHWDRITAMVDAARTQLDAHKQARDVFTEVGKAEQTLVWTDDHGVICKARLDWLRNDYTRIGDYKSTGSSVNPEAMARFAVSQHWDIQAAFYRRGVQKITGKDPDFLFIAQEDSQPHALTVVGMAPSFNWYGEKRVQAAIDLWAKCLEKDDWPGYPDKIVYPDLPSYAESAWLEKELSI